MLVLKNAKHERFAQELAKGRTAGEAADAAEIVLRPCKELKGFYVYLLVDPRDGMVFYVGKGKGRRHAAHVRDWKTGNCDNLRKGNKIGEILASGTRPLELCVDDDLSEGEALSIERAIITGAKANLCNLSPGQLSWQQRDMLWGQNMLRRLKSFDEWVTERPRSKLDIEVYRSVAKEFVNAAFGLWPPRVMVFRTRGLK